MSHSRRSVPGMGVVSSSPEMTPILMVQRPVATLERMLSFPQKPYAIQEKDGKASPPVVFSEQKEVFRRIAKKFCPGPIVIYLNANPDLQLVLDRVSAAGGQIIMGKTLIDDQVGYMAFIVDTEGNKVGLHSGHQ